MPGSVVTLLNVAMCSHGGQAKPVPPAGRVTIMGMGAVNLMHQYLVMGCTYPAMTSGAQPPCVSGQFTAGATRVSSMGIPLAILPPPVPPLCKPTMQPLVFAPAGQTRVYAT